MEEQLEFDFMKAMDNLIPKTCVNCKHADKYVPVCRIDSSDVHKDYTCEHYEYNEELGMKEIAQDTAKRFIDLMDKYNVSLIDREEIYRVCRWF